MDWNQDPDEAEYQEFLKHLISMRKVIKEPLSDDQLADIIEYWDKHIGGYLNVIAEQFHLGEDEEGYIILANLTPDTKNPDNAYYCLYRHENYKHHHRAQYKVEFISEYDENEESDEDPEVVPLGSYNNFISVIDTMCIHWQEYNRLNYGIL